MQLCRRLGVIEREVLTKKRESSLMSVLSRPDHRVIPNTSVCLTNCWRRDCASALSFVVSTRVLLGVLTQTVDATP